MLEAANSIQESFSRSRQRSLRGEEELRISNEVVGAAIEVHRRLGPGLYESVYEKALEYELRIRGLAALRQQAIDIRYKDLHIGPAFRADVVVENRVIVEVKSVKAIEDVHKKQLLTYLRLSGLSLGLLLNFNVPLLKNGICRILNGDFDEIPSCSS